MKSEKLILQLIEQKIYNVISNRLRKYIKPNLALKEVNDIDLELLKKLKSIYGIGGIILDIDETIRKDMMKIPDCNKDIINDIYGANKCGMIFAIVDNVRYDETVDI